jgi:hypothetical protein
MAKKMETIWGLILETWRSSHEAYYLPTYLPTYQP